MAVGLAEEAFFDLVLSLAMVSTGVPVAVEGFGVNGLEELLENSQDGGADPDMCRDAGRRTKGESGGDPSTDERTCEFQNQSDSHLS